MKGDWFHLFELSTCVNNLVKYQQQQIRKMTRMTSSLRTVTIIILWLSSVWSLSNQQSEKSSIASNSSTIQLLGQFTEKILTKLSSNLNQLNPHINRAKARGYDWSYLDG